MINKRLLNLGIGLAAGLIGGKILKSKTAKDLAVNTVAGGLKVKDSIDKTIEDIRENTNDIIAEAKVKKAEEEKARKEAEEKNLEDLAEEKEAWEWAYEGKYSPQNQGKDAP